MSGSVTLLVNVLLTTDWRVMCWIWGTLVLLHWVACALWLAESPCWCYERGDVHAAQELLQQASRDNGVSFPPKWQPRPAEGPGPGPPLSATDWGALVAMKTPVMMLLGFTIMLVYFGLDDGVEIMLSDIDARCTLLLFGLLDLLATVAGVWLADSALARGRVLAAIMFLLGGSFVASLAAAPFTFVGRFLSDVASTVYLIHGTDLYPTSVRSLACGILQNSGKAGAVVAPILLRQLGETFTTWACATLGLLCSGAALLCL